MIYLIQDTLTELVKIGYTKNEHSMKRRLSDIQSSCPGTLMLLGTTQGDEQKEKSLHTVYRKQHYRGEWFRLTNIEIEEILEASPKQDHQKLKRLTPALPVPPERPCMKWFMPTLQDYDRQRMMLRQRLSTFTSILIGCDPEVLPYDIKRSIGTFVKDYVTELRELPPQECQPNVPDEQVIKYEKEYRKYAKECNEFYDQMAELLNHCGRLS